MRQTVKIIDNHPFEFRGHTLVCRVVISAIMEPIKHGHSNVDDYLYTFVEANAYFDLFKGSFGVSGEIGTIEEAMHEASKAKIVEQACLDLSLEMERVASMLFNFKQKA